LNGEDGQHETEKPDHTASLGDFATSSTRTKFSVHTTAAAMTFRIEKSPDTNVIVGEGPIEDGDAGLSKKSFRSPAMAVTATSRST
jgi:hypothetical protein